MASTPGAGQARPGAATAAPGAAATPTPSRRALSHEPRSSRPSLWTPLDRSASRDLLASLRRGGDASGGRRRAPGNGGQAPTPHAKAARLALDRRRDALFTPGRNKRRSLMEQRETPMGILRNLGRALAPKSKPVVTSSSPGDQPPAAASAHQLDDEDNDDDELSIDAPRLSLPLDHDDQDSDPLPPRSSGLEDENYTAQSIELPRRALSEQPTLRLSRGSFANARISDVLDQGANDATLDAARHSDFFPGLLEQLQARTAAGDVTLDRIDVDPARRTTMGRESDFGLQLPAGPDDQTTFVLSEPSAAPGADSLVMDPSLAEAAAAQGADELPDAPPAQDDDAAAMTEMEDDGVDLTPVPDAASDPGPRARKRLKRISKHGVEFPPLPPSFVKRVAQTALHSSGLSNPRISADTLAALVQASDWFFEQLGDDLGAYAQHAKRKTVEESDVVTLMRRQRQVGPDATLFSLAQRHLPRELLQDLRMPVPQPTKKRRGKRPRGDDEVEVEEHETEVT